MSTAAIISPQDEAPRPAPRLKLYEAADALDIVAELLAETEGELTPEIEALLEQATGDFDAKAERVALKVREFKLEAAAVKEEAGRLGKRAKARENAAESLRNYLLRHMQRAERPKIKGTLVSMRVQDNQPKLIGAESLGQATLAELRELRPEYVTTQPERIVPESLSLNAAAILDEWKRVGGTALAGVPASVSIEVDQHIVIR